MTANGGSASKAAGSQTGEAREPGGRVWNVARYDAPPAYDERCRCVEPEASKDAEAIGAMNSSSSYDTELIAVLSEDHRVRSWRGSSALCERHNSSQSSAPLQPRPPRARVRLRGNLASAAASPSAAKYAFASPARGTTTRQPGTRDAGGYDENAMACASVRRARRQRTVRTLGARRRRASASRRRHIARDALATRWRHRSLADALFEVRASIRWAGGESSRTRSKRSSGWRARTARSRTYSAG